MVWRPSRISPSRMGEVASKVTCGPRLPPKQSFCANSPLRASRSCADRQQRSHIDSPAIVADQRIQPCPQLIRRAKIPDAAEQIAKALVGGRLALDALDG